jgi:ubiquinone biosynthesis protein
MELDFRREAEVIGDLREALAHRKDAVVPEVIKGLNTERLLVMEFMEGIKITDRRGLVNAGIEPERVAGLLTNVYAEQLFERGVFHADPHPGNLFVQPGPEGPVLVLLDHGLTVSVPDELVAAMREAIEALQEGDFEALAGALQRAGLDLSPDLDLQILLGLVGVLLGGDSGEAANGEETNLGQFGIRLGASVRHIPNDLLLVGRAIGLVDGITRQLHSDLDTIKIVAQHAQDA